jgi:hypothetical protein
MLRQTVHKQYSESHYENRVEIRKPFLVHIARSAIDRRELFSAPSSAIPCHPALASIEFERAFRNLPEVEASSVDFIMSL